MAVGDRWRNWLIKRALLFKFGYSLRNLAQKLLCGARVKPVVVCSGLSWRSGFQSKHWASKQVAGAAFTFDSSVRKESSRVESLRSKNRLKRVCVCE